MKESKKVAKYVANLPISKYHLSLASAICNTIIHPIHAPDAISPYTSNTSNTTSSSPHKFLQLSSPLLLHTSICLALPLLRQDTTASCRLILMWPPRHRCTVRRNTVATASVAPFPKHTANDYKGEGDDEDNYHCDPLLVVVPPEDIVG